MKSRRSEKLSSVKPVSIAKGSANSKRLTIDISPELHKAIKIACAGRGAKMADEIRALLAEKYQGKRSEK